MYTNLEENDRIFGKILSQLDEDGLTEDTVVFHWSDHGPLPRGKRWLYDSGIHVPLIIRWPGHTKPGSVSHRLVSTIDLGPTVLSIAGISPPQYMQGIPFLGKYAKPPRKYVYASRDRIDESYDMVRTVRDKRYKYIRNFYPFSFYSIWGDYLNKHPIMEELWLGFITGKLNRVQSLLFQTRPSEELYDVEKDPWEICNLVDNPEYQNHLDRLRKALEQWMQQIEDTGKISESEMVNAWYEQGKQPETATPLVIPLNKKNYGVEAICEDGTYEFEAPLFIQLYCATQGASIGYHTNDNSNWNLYTKPIKIPEGKTLFIAKAIRIGYKESKERRVVLIVK